jgi:aspartyl-tRNA(Asn)/glutamyl-tRNA(Gln) amidotransferase subunit B
MRTKEGSSDYRYFPEPDLTPIELSKETLEEWRSQLPPLPADKRHHYHRLGLSAYDARVLTDDAGVADYFDRTLAAGADPKLAANWIMGDIMGYLNNEKLGIDQIALTPESLAELVTLIAETTISNKIGKDLLPDLLTKGGSPKAIVAEKGLTQISDPAQLNAMIDEVLVENPKELEQFRNGKTKLQGFFVGQLMKKTSGRADPKLANQLLVRKLNES